MEYRGLTNLFSVVVGDGEPLRVDPIIITRKSGPYCRVLVDIDCQNELPDRLLV